jgi:hypothetical protein
MEYKTVGVTMHDALNTEIVPIYVDALVEMPVNNAYRIVASFFSLFISFFLVASRSVFPATLHLHPSPPFLLLSQPPQVLLTDFIFTVKDSILPCGRTWIIQLLDPASQNPLLTRHDTPRSNHPTYVALL